MQQRPQASHHRGAAWYDECFRRLARLQGGDPGFFILAVHAFVEDFLRSTMEPNQGDFFGFNEYLQELRRVILSESDGWVPDVGVLDLMRQQHQITNDVRHRFAKATVEDARAATHHLRRFCQLVGIPDTRTLRKLQKYLHAWEDRRSYPEVLKELKDIGYKFQQERKSAMEMAQRVARLEAAQAEAVALADRVRAMDRGIRELERELEAATQDRDERLEALRRDRAELARNYRAAQERITLYRDAQDYLKALSRFTVLCRSRADYERSLVLLTPAQEEVIAQIDLDGDFLIKGAAGTGKTLILLRAVAKAKAGPSAGTATGSPGTGPAQAATGHAQAGTNHGPAAPGAILLTYTSTLVKYDRYLSDIMAPGAAADRTLTADVYLRERLHAFEPDAAIDYGIARHLAERAPHELPGLVAASGLGARELAHELEDFIWANALTRAEYVDGMIERRGMRHPLGSRQRAAVWELGETFARAMTRDRRYSQAWSRIVLLGRIAEAGVTDPRLADTDYLFIDEAQDLSAAELRVLKACARRAVILAGDSDQSIYQPGFTFRRAGIDIAGRTRVLTTDFRSTTAIHALAERYRALTPGADPDSLPEAFKDGPLPELFTEPDTDRLLQLLAARAQLCVERLGYAPENIAILVPSNEDMPQVAASLDRVGFSTVNIKASEFEFDQAGAVRMSTFHSAKGIDFPVVLALLHRPPYVGSGWDDATADRMVRNLVYVGITRAMDHLALFMRGTGTGAGAGTATYPALDDLAGCFG